MSKHIHIVVNPAAGQPEPILAVVNRVFREAGVDWTVSVTHESGDARRQAQEAAEGGADLVAAYGGDGTVMEVVNGLIGGDTPLALLPGGTGNVLSVELGVPQDLERAARLACSDEAELREVDVGRCGEDHFLLRLAAGFSAKQIGLTSRELRDQYGKLAYFIAGLQALPETRPVHYTFTLDGREVEFEGVTCLVANAGSMGLPGLSLSPSIRISDGLLDVIALRDLDLGSLSALAVSIAAMPADSAGLGYWQAREITIASEPPQPVVGDGEPWGETPVTVEVQPQAVRVVVPASAETQNQP